MKQFNNKTINPNGKPFVSVIIPVFNGAFYLEETISSIQKSTYKHYEIILVDDGSTDHSREVCRKLQKQYPNVHFYRFSKNKGLGRVLNFALKKAKGEYICRINQDDRMLPHRMETQVAFLAQNSDVVAVGSHIKLFDKNSNSTIVEFLERDEDIKKVWLMLSPFSDPSVMYRKTAAIKAGGYDQSYWPADDVHLWYRMGNLGKLANIQKPLVEVRWHKEAGSIKFFRRNTLVTYKLHRWANRNIAKAPFLIQAFWLGQLICGLTLPPSFNWAVYRILKKVVNTISTTKIIDLALPKAYAVIVNRAQNLNSSTTETSVTSHPNTINRSGV